MIIRDIKGRFVKGYTRAITWNTGLKGKGICKGYNKGKTLSEETRKKISESLTKNPIRFWKGKKLSPESIIKRTQYRIYWENYFGAMHGMGASGW